MALRIRRSRIPELLASAGITQAELARNLEVTESFVSQVIDLKKSFSYFKAKKAALLLGCSMDDLDDWEGVETVVLRRR